MYKKALACTIVFFVLMIIMSNTSYSCFFADGRSIFLAKSEYANKFQDDPPDTKLWQNLRPGWNRMDKPSYDHEGKTAYLTFDDGPSADVTPKVLNILKDENIRATFFVVGNMIPGNESLLKRMEEDGHLICNHSYSHDYKMVYSNPEGFLADFQQCKDAFRMAVGHDFSTNIIRFPGGTSGRKRLVFMDAADTHGFRYIDWNATTGSSAPDSELSTETLFKDLESSLRGQHQAVILIHDTPGKRVVAESLPEIIRYLKDLGYTFDTVDHY